MSRTSLVVQKRDASGKSPVARRLRKEGLVPGVVYGASTPESFSVGYLELNAMLRKGVTLVDLEIEGGDKKLTVIKDYQVHPVRGNVVHIDLQEVTMNQTVRTVVQLQLVGENIGVKAGGIITQGMRELHIESQADAIPEVIEHDITNLDLGEVLILRDLPVQPGVTYLDDPGNMIVTISIPRGAKGLKRASDGTPEGDAAAAADEAAAQAAGDSEA
ncbi:MAG: 50S ribosomal protein L25 [Thermoleophilia bacterium]|nr:50S ribosomal protein L25 [Thermoleophilia bacterium]